MHLTNKACTDWSRLCYQNFSLPSRWQSWQWGRHLCHPERWSPTFAGGSPSPSQWWSAPSPWWCLDVKARSSWLHSWTPEYLYCLVCRCPRTGPAIVQVSSGHRRKETIPDQTRQRSREGETLAPTRHFTRQNEETYQNDEWNNISCHLFWAKSVSKNFELCPPWIPGIWQPFFTTVVLLAFLTLAVGSIGRVQLNEL